MVPWKGGTLSTTKSFRSDPTFGTNPQISYLNTSQCVVTCEQESRLSFHVSMHRNFAFFTSESIETFRELTTAYIVYQKKKRRLLKDLGK